MTELNKKYLYFALISFILIGIFTRFYKLDFQCFWLEEEYTLNVARLSFGEIWTLITTTDFTPPLFYWIEHAMGLAFGYGHDILRIPSAVAGVLCIPAMYWLGKSYKDEFTGLTCAGLVTIIYPFIYYSQFARGYAESFLLFTITLTLFLKIRGGDKQIKTYALFGIFGAITIWVHMYAAIPISLLLLALLITDWGKGSRISAACYILILLPLIQMVNTLFSIRVHTTNEFPYGLKWFELIAITPLEFFNNVFPFIGILVVFGWFFERERKVVWEILIISIITIIFGVLLANYMPMYPRYYMTVASAFILIAAVGFSELTKFITKTDWIMITILMAMLIFFVIFQNEGYLGHYLFQKYVCEV